MPDTGTGVAAFQLQTPYKWPLPCGLDGLRRESPSPPAVLVSDLFSNGRWRGGGLFSRGDFQVEPPLELSEGSCPQGGHSSSAPDGQVAGAALPPGGAASPSWRSLIFWSGRGSSSYPESWPPALASGRARGVIVKVGGFCFSDLSSGRDQPGMVGEWPLPPRSCMLGLTGSQSLVPQDFLGCCVSLVGACWGGPSSSPSPGPSRQEASPAPHSSPGAQRGGEEPRPPGL